jgi:signal transduction histidine kinase/DNA-binding response OmpR family regulator/ligand-binding sensor domain-containing protein
MVSPGKYTLEHDLIFEHEMMWKESGRRFRGAVLLLALLPTVMAAQIHTPDEPILVTPPGIDHHLEKFEPLSRMGNMYTWRFTMDLMGFFWCATNSGLGRFDGYEMKLYSEDLADTAGIFRSQVQIIAVDGDGFVWGATPNAGVVKLDPATGEKRWYQGRIGDSTGIGGGALRVFVASDGILWAGGQYGLAKYDRISDTFIGYPLPSDYPRIEANTVNPAYAINSICELGRSIWVGLGGGGLGELNRDTGIWKRYQHDPTSKNCPSAPKVRAVCPDLSGRLWLGTNGGDLDCFDPQRGTWRHFAVTKNGIVPREKVSTSVRSNPTWWIVRDSLGGLWITATSVGIFRLDPVSGKAVLYQHDRTDANSLPWDSHNWLGVSGQGRVSSSPQAQPGSVNVWVPCGLAGMYRFVVSKNPCTTFWIGPPKGFLQGARIGVFAIESPGKYWVIQWNGALGLVDGVSRTVRWHSDILAGIRRLAQLRDKTILVANMDYEAWTYDRPQDRFVPLAKELRVSCFVEGSDSIVWLGCRRQSGMTYIAAFDRKNGRYTVYPRQDPDSASYRDNDVTAMSIDGRGALWYGTEGGGLIRFDLHSRTYHRFAGHPSSEDDPMANGVNAIIPDSGGKVWVGTVAGLVLMDMDRGSFKHIHYTVDENSEPLIMCMADDGEGHLWIAAREGPLCFTKATRTFRRLTPPNQVWSRYLWSALFDPRSRTVIFGAHNGFFSFPLDDPPPASPPPAVVLTSFRVFEKDYPLDADIAALKSISLPHSASFFSMTFAALNYVDPAKNRYAYKMEGVDPEWVQAGTRRYVSYTNLNPGTYTFEVRGANSEGIWSEKPTTLEITILPPWYRTTWAYGAYFLTFMGLLYVLRGLDRRRAALKHNLEMKSFEAAKMHELDQMKSAFFANISHEFRTPLTLILGPLEQFAERFKHDEQAQATVSLMRRNGLRLLQLINQLLDLSKMDAGKMNVQIRPIEVVGLSRSLVMSFLSLADRKKISLIFDPEQDEIIAYTDRDKYEKILTNLLSNGFKFTGEGGEIKVILRTLEGNAESGVIPPAGAVNRFELVVADTGIGIDQAHIGKVFDRFYQVETSHDQERGGTGIGLALVKELVEVLKGTITVKSSPGHGSTFTVQLPLRKESWRSEDIVTDERIADSQSAEVNAAAFAETQHAEAAPSAQHSGKPLVLIVEDNVDVRAYIREFLAEEYAIEEAENGKVALQKARAIGIDLVVSDVMMPVMDGVQFCRELKTDDRINHIPVILLTARATIEGKLEGLDIGADDYIVKPFDARELMARVKNLIASRKTLRDKYHQQVTLGPTAIPVASTDERFLKRLSEQLEQHIADPAYDTESLAHDMCMSRMQLNRKLHALTGHSTHGVVRDFRLQRAEQLLRAGAENISGVAYDVGFSSLSHFAHAFREKFGVNPSEYGKQGADPDGP